MPRRRSTSPAPRSSPPPPPARAPAAHAPAAHPPAPAQQAQPPAVVQEQPSMFKQMAATAGGVAVGSAVGHAVGSAMTGMFSGGGSSGQAVAAAPQEATPTPLSRPEPTGACAFEIKQFLKCADEHNNDLSLCDGFNEALRQCKQTHHLV